MPSANICKSRHLIKALRGSSLKQLIKSSTRGDNVLDLVFTNEDLVSEVKVEEFIGGGRKRD